MKARGLWLVSLRALLCLVLCLPFAVAQLQPEAQAALERAQALAHEARAAYTGTVNTIDQPLWRSAIGAGQEALELAPEAPEVLRFLAETYAAVGWDIRAWDFWLRYQEAGGALDEAVQEGLSEVGDRLGYARYSAGDLTGAIDYYRRVHERVPQDREAIVWLGRIFFELGQPEEALPYWQRLVEANPDDEGAKYYLNRTRQQLAVGVEASNAFQEGILLYDQGRLEEALAAFQRAAEANPRFSDAFVWIGRTNLELGRPEAAKTGWTRVLELDPDDERAHYFLGVAENQLTWGVEAAQAFEAGLVAYDRGDLEAAAEHFAAATSANPGYKEAAVWAARSYQELGRPERAIALWERVLALDPSDGRAEYFLELARDQARFGIAAASAFSQGLSNYQLARFDEAEAQFRLAVEARPDYAEAWAWLGRVHFDQADYAEAADAYGRALTLEPGNESYRFFAEEAVRLAGRGSGN